MLLIDHTVLLLYFAGNVRAARMIDLINDSKEEGYICETSMLELMEKLSKVFEYEEVSRRIEAIKNSGIKIVGFDYEVGKKAIKISKMYNLPLSRAYVIALAMHLNATLVTADKRSMVVGLRSEHIEP